MTLNSGGSTGLSLSATTYMLQSKGSLLLTWDAILSLWVQDNGSAGLGEPTVRRVSTATTTASTTWFFVTDIADVFCLTAQAHDLGTITSSDTPFAGDRLELQITDNGTARTLAWATGKFEASNVGTRGGTLALPTTTVIN